MQSEVCATLCGFNTKAVAIVTSLTKIRVCVFQTFLVPGTYNTYTEYWVYERMDVAEYLFQPVEISPFCWEKESVQMLKALKKILEGDKFYSHWQVY